MVVVMVIVVGLEFGYVSGRLFLEGRGHGRAYLIKYI